MFSLGGPISDKLRKLFAKDDPAWKSGRPGSPTKGVKNPKGIEGHKLGGRKKFGK